MPEIVSTTFRVVDIAMAVFLLLSEILADVSTRRDTKRFKDARERLDHFFIQASPRSGEMFIAGKALREIASSFRTQYSVAHKWALDSGSVRGL